jgi:hypothetical protein
MSSDPAIANRDPMFAGTDGHTVFLKPVDVQTFNSNIGIANYDSKYSRSALKLIDGNTAVKISAVETTTSGQPYGLNIETSARFRDTTLGSTNTSLQHIEGNVTVKADTIIQGNLLVQDFTYPPTANRNVSGDTRRVGISATNFHTESQFVEDKVLKKTDGNPVTTLTSQGVIYNRGEHNYCSKVDIDDQGVRIGTVLNAGNASDRLVLDRVYVENDLRLGSTLPYIQALPGNQAYPAVDPCLDINYNTSLFTTRKGPIGRVALNSNNVDIVFSDDSAPSTIVTTTSVDQDSKDYVFPRTALLGDVVNNVSFLTDGPMADEIKRRIGTLDSSIQSVDLGDLKATDTKFSSYVSSPVGGVFNLRDTAGILKALNLKVDAIGQGLTPELLNTILDIANRLQGSEQYNIMAELSLLQRSIGYLTSRLDSLTAEEFDLKDNFASMVLALDAKYAFVHYRTAILNRLSSDTKNYSTVSAGIYYKYTGYNLAVGGVRALGGKEYYYNPHSGSGFFYDSTMGKWAYVTGVCLYTSAEGLVTKDDKTLYDDFIPEERSISTVFTGTGNSLWSFDSEKNYEDSYYGSMTTNFLSLYEKEDDLPGLYSAAAVIVSLTNTLAAVSTEVLAFWESLTNNQKLAFSGKNFTGDFSSVEYIRNDMKVLGVSFGTMLDTDVQAFARDFRNDTAYNEIKTVVSPMVSAAATVVYPVSTVLDEKGQPASEGWYSSLAGRRVFRQRRYQFQYADAAFVGWPVFGFTADTEIESTINYLKLTYISGVDDKKRDDLTNYILVAANGTSIICWDTTDSNSPVWRRFEFMGTVASLIEEKLFHMSLDEALPGAITSMSFEYNTSFDMAKEETPSSTHIDFNPQSVLRQEVVTCNFTAPSS